MLPYNSLIALDKQIKTPLFLQITNGLMAHIKSGLIPKGTKLPGSRALADVLGVNRQTVVAAFDELLAQGWIEIKASKGTFVSSKIPVITPTDELARAYRSVLQKGYQKQTLFYGDTKGEPSLRHEITAFLKETRGLNISVDNVMITRGSMMAMFLTANTVLRAGDKVVLGELDYGSISLIFENTGAEMVKIRIDDKGLDVEHLAEICEKTPIRMVYLTPHHHYPTTVTMPAERRLRLLELAKIYGFCILEDDYDYDFRYSSSPILPLASVDTEGYVVYFGSLSKLVSPALRVGFMVAPSDLIEEMSRFRRTIDRQGDNMTEAALAILFKDGTVKRHLKKAQKAYHKRRDVLCEGLKSELSAWLDFQKPNGGMAVWTKFDPSVSLPILSQKAEKMGLLMSDGATFNMNATRLGFASTNEMEIERGVDILKKSII